MSIPAVTSTREAMKSWSKNSAELSSPLSTKKNPYDDRPLRQRTRIDRPSLSAFRSRHSLRPPPSPTRSSMAPQRKLGLCRRSPLRASRSGPLALRAAASKNIRHLTRRNCNAIQPALLTHTPHWAPRFRAIRAARAQALPAASSAAIVLPVPKKTSSGVCPSNAE